MTSNLKLYRSLGHNKFLLACARFICEQCIEREIFNIPAVDVIQFDIDRGENAQSRDMLTIFTAFPTLGTQAQFLSLCMIRESLEKLNDTPMKSDRLDVYRQQFEYAVKHIGYSGEEAKAIFRNMLFSGAC